LPQVLVTSHNFLRLS